MARSCGPFEEGRSVSRRICRENSFQGVRVLGPLVEMLQSDRLTIESLVGLPKTSEGRDLPELPEEELGFGDRLKRNIRMIQPTVLRISLAFVASIFLAILTVNFFGMFSAEGPMDFLRTHLETAIVATVGYFTVIILFFLRK